MIKKLVFLGMAAILSLFIAFSCGAEEEAAPAPADEGAEWTVLIYLCGSDLESQYGFATGNLLEIAGVHEPENQVGELIKDVRAISDLQVKLPGKVHIVLETGGSTEWHAQQVDMDIRTDCLQDWEYIPGTGGGNGAPPLSQQAGGEPAGRAPYSAESGGAIRKLGGTAEHLRPRAWDGVFL